MDHHTIHDRHRHVTAIFPALYADEIGWINWIVRHGVKTGYRFPTLDLVLPANAEGPRFPSGLCCESTQPNQAYVDWCEVEIREALDLMVNFSHVRKWWNAPTGDNRFTG